MSGPAHAPASRIDARPAGLGLLALVAAGALAWLPADALWAVAGLVALAAWALAVLVRPVVGLATAALLVPFGRELLPALGPLAAPLPLLWTALAMGLRAASRTEPDGRPSPRLRPEPGALALLLALALYVAVLGASAWRAPSAAASLEEIARWIELGLAFALAAALPRRDGPWLAAGLLLAGGAAAAAGIALAAAGTGPEAFAIAGARRLRAYGTFGQPNPFGGYMNLIWPLGAALLAGRLLPAPRWRAARRAGADRAVPAALAGLGAACGGLAGLGLVLSWSRGAWLAALAGAAAMGLAWLGERARGPADGRVLAGLWLGATGLLLALLLGATPALPTGVASRLASIAETGAGGGIGAGAGGGGLRLPDVRDAEVTDASFATVERLAHWQAAGRMWEERPWLGQGPGHWELVYDAHRLGRWGEALGHAHNYYLHAAAESGLLGLAAFLGFAGAALALALRGALAPRGILEAALALGLVGALAATATHSLFDNLFVHEIPIHVGLWMGLVVALRSRP